MPVGNVQNTYGERLMQPHPRQLQAFDTSRIGKGRSPSPGGNSSPQGKAFGGKGLLQSTNFMTGKGSAAGNGGQAHSVPPHYPHVPAVPNMFDIYTPRPNQNGPSHLQGGGEHHGFTGHPSEFDSTTVVSPCGEFKRCRWHGCQYMAATSMQKYLNSSWVRS